MTRSDCIREVRFSVFTNAYSPAREVVCGICNNKIPPTTEDGEESRVFVLKSFPLCQKCIDDMLARINKMREKGELDER